MGKESKTDELTEILSDDYCDMFDDGQGQDCCRDCGDCRARRVIDAGYRKADEVRKETAREILREFRDIHWGQSEFDNVFIRLCEKYGIEVNE